jgi:S-adenosylmethionine:tRNA ribosyltransferase-isomerase
MHLSEFDYELPESRIAQTPAEPRDSARLLVDRGGAGVDHRHVRDLGDYLEPGDLMVVNDTRVIPARLLVQRSTGAQVEVLLLEALDDDSRRWTALVRPGGRLREGEILHHRESGLEVSFVGRSLDEGSFEIELNHDGDALAFLERCGQMPLPPYLKASQNSSATDERYQTVYSRRPASAAAPTAGLHLTHSLLDSLRAKGVGIAQVELVVGVDTFRPITEEDPLRHSMHSEFYSVSAEVMDRVQKAKRVVAIGTTAVRSLESAAQFNELTGRTKLYIHRGFHWQAVDLMMTNFHMPRTTLLVMIDAFIGSRWREIYQTALDDEYRFLSFGDAMLLNRHLI